MRNKIKLRVVTICSGIGCQERGIENTGLFDVDVVATSEIDKYAIVSYAAIHKGLTNETIFSFKDYPSLDEMKQYLTDLNIGYIPEKDKKYNWFQNGKKFNEDVKRYWLACKLNNNLGDITKIEQLPEADLWTISTPCTDISLAGKLKGLNPDDKTRSSLIWQNIRLLKRAQETNTLPKYILLENVKNLIGKRFIHDFETFNELIESFGYYTYYKALNACECDVPQNRERVFAIYIRTDIDSGKFTFPLPFDNGLRFKDVLEEEVDEKYYINTEKAQALIQKLIDDGTLDGAKSSSETKPIGILDSNGYKRINKVYYEGGLLPCVLANDYKNPIKVLVCERKKVKIIGNIFGFTGGNYAGTVYDKNYFAPTLNTMQGGLKQPLIIDKYRIRKITENECFKLMGLTSEDCNKCKGIGVSKSQLYRQAGNGIVSNCVELLFEHLYKAQYDPSFVTFDKLQTN